MRLAGQAKGGFYPTPETVIARIAELFYVSSSANAAQDVVRLLDPCCGEGDALSELAQSLSSQTTASIETYGIELHRDRAKQAAEVLSHTLPADLFATTIANNAFGVMLLNPPYDWDKQDKRVEHAFLTHCTRYLMPEGVLVFIVPKPRLATSARYLANNYTQIACWYFPEPEREDYDQVILVAERKHQPVPDARAEDEILAWAYGQPLTISSTPTATYLAQLSDTTGDILFATRTVDPVAAVQEAAKHGLWTNQEIIDSLWPIEDRPTRPLMPLRKGHLAMLVAAGFLDNLVLESHGTRILVKGRTTKKMTLADEDPEKEVYREHLQTTVVSVDLDNGFITDIAA